MRGMGEDDSRLSVEEAATMPDDELHERFWVMATDLVGTFGESALPPNFPKSVAGMTRADIIGPLTEHEYWFNPPARPDEASAGTPCPAGEEAGL